MTTKTLVPNGNRLYPWDRWQDGKPHKAARGKNFQITPEQFRKSLHMRATRIGQVVETRVRGDVVWFQFGGK
jgi:hypothetical protein